MKILMQHQSEILNIKFLSCNFSPTFKMFPLYKILLTWCAGVTFIQHQQLHILHSWAETKKFLEEGGGGSLACDQMDASWMDDLLILVLTLCSPPHAIKPQYAPQVGLNFFFPLRSFPSRDGCCRCRANHAISSCISCYMARARVKTDVTAIIGCEGPWCHGRGGAPCTTDPWLRLFSSSLFSFLSPSLPFLSPRL